MFACTQGTRKHIDSDWTGFAASIPFLLCLALQEFPGVRRCLEVVPKVVEVVVELVLKVFGALEACCAPGVVEAERYGAREARCRRADVEA